MPFHRYLIFVGINVIYKKLPRVSRELSARSDGSKMQVTAFFLSCLTAYARKHSLRRHRNRAKPPQSLRLLSPRYGTLADKSNEFGKKRARHEAAATQRIRRAVIYATYGYRPPATFQYGVLETARQTYFLFRFTGGFLPARFQTLRRRTREKHFAS